MRSLNGLLGLCATVALVLTGCNGGLNLDTVPVTGTVMMDGKPVEGAAVTFSPEGAGHAAAAVTDASGKFQLTTDTAGDGAVAGKYKVTVTKYEKRTETIAAGEEDMDAVYAAMEAAGEDVSGSGDKRGTENDGPKNELPAQYANPKTTTLQAEVSEGGENDFTFEIE